MASKIKLPEFLEDSPLTWWLQCQSVFETCKVVKSVEQYHHLIGALPASVTSKLLDVMTAEPYEEEDTGKMVDPRYDLLKTALIEQYSPNQLDAYVKFHEVPKLQTGQKPSNLFAVLRAALPADVKPDSSPWWFESAFLIRLPEHTRAVCQSKKFESMAKMASFADTVVAMEWKPSLPPRMMTIQSHVTEEEAVESCCATAVKRDLCC